MPRSRRRGSNSCWRTGPASSPPPWRRGNWRAWTSSATAGWRVHIISGGDDAEQARDGDFLSKSERYARTDDYLDGRPQKLDQQRPVRSRRTLLPEVKGSFAQVAAEAEAAHPDLFRRQFGRGHRGRGQACRCLRLLGRAGAGRPPPPSPRCARAAAKTWPRTGHPLQPLAAPHPGPHGRRSLGPGAAHPRRRQGPDLRLSLAQRRPCCGAAECGIAAPSGSGEQGAGAGQAALDRNRRADRGAGQFDLSWSAPRNRWPKACSTITISASRPS